MSNAGSRRALALAIALLVAAGVGLISTARVRDQLQALAICEASDAERWDVALARSAGPIAADEAGRAAAQCRCTALLARGRGDECADLLERAWSDADDPDWAPAPPLAEHLVQTLRERGRTPDAAAFARRAGAAHPHEPSLFHLELATRGAVEDEPALLRELALRLPDAGPGAARMRATLAERHLLRADPAEALRALGDAPPPGAGAALPRWFETRGMAFAFAGDLAGVRRSYEQWHAAGGAPDELLARYALTLSLAGLAEPERDPITLLGGALARRAGLDPALQERLVIRQILTLVNAGRQDEALALFDAERERFALAGLRREELRRSAAQRELAALPAAERRGRLRFELPVEARGGSLWLSPPPDAPADRPYEELAVPASGRVEAERSLGSAPQRWVAADASGRTLASGTVSPVAGERVVVRVAAREPRAPAEVRLARRPADGRRRVMLLLLDCGDWRLVQYLRTRGELPVLDALVARGYRAVLESDPPLTAAALESLVWPGRESSRSFVGLVHQFGVELAGLADVGRNPFAALGWILPEREDLFSTVGAGPLRAANLLLAHGGRRAGRHGEVTGPRGERRLVPVATSARDLDPAERSRFPGLAAVREERDALLLRTIAAELDVAEETVRAGEIDLLALRVEPLDLLTHAHFADAVRDGQDDGRGVLFSVYRYLDARVGQVDALLDGDDVLVVMSDHGIRTAMEHSEDALFVAVGGGVPAGRAADRPDLRGVPRVLAALLGVSADWPDTGVAAWADARAAR